jgi:dethiobiotin synthetase
MGKAIVVIDGVGSPSVGSVVGVANIDMATLFPCRIIFVGKSGIGAAIDNTVLNISFIQRQHKQNIGLIYNQIPLSALSETQHYVSKRIVQLLPNTSPLGFIAHNQELALLLQESSETIAAWFSAYVNQHYLLNNWFKLDK